LIESWARTLCTPLTDSDERIFGEDLIGNHAGDRFQALKSQDQAVRTVPDPGQKRLKLRQCSLTSLGAFRITERPRNTQLPGETRTRTGQRIDVIDQRHDIDSPNESGQRVRTRSILDAHDLKLLHAPLQLQLK